LAAESLWPTAALVFAGNYTDNYPQPNFPTTSGCLPANTSTWFTSAAGKHYRIYNLGIDWVSANNYCRQQGGYLVTYHTRQEQLDVEVGRGAAVPLTGAAAAGLATGGCAAHAYRACLSRCCRRLADLLPKQRRHDAHRVGSLLHDWAEADGRLRLFDMDVDHPLLECGRFRIRRRRLACFQVIVRLAFMRSGCSNIAGRHPSGGALQPDRHDKQRAPLPARCHGHCCRYNRQATDGRWTGWYSGDVEGWTNYNYVAYVECLDGYRIVGADNRETCGWRPVGQGAGYPFVCVQNCEPSSPALQSSDNALVDPPPQWHTTLPC
jgi:hypothetical protein